MASMSGTAWMRPAFVCGMLAVTLLTPVRPGEQDLTSSQLKTAFTYHFIKYTDWPIVPPASDPSVICVVGDADVVTAVEAMIKGRDIDGRRIVALVKISRPTPACQVLYVS